MGFKRGEMVIKRKSEIFYITYRNAKLIQGKDKNEIYISIGKQQSMESLWVLENKTKISI